MTAKQFWNKTFTGQSIFEVMEDFAREREQALVKTLNERLQTAEAKRIEAQNHLLELQKRHTEILHLRLTDNNGDDGDL